jgi:hypothetical protein
MNAEAMRLELELINWDIFFSDCINCDEMWVKFKSLCHALISEYVPSIEICNAKAKISRTVRKALSKKRALYKRRHLSPAHMGRYKSACAYCKSIIAEDTLIRESKVLESPNQRKFYNYVNKRLSSRPSISGIADTNGNLLRSDELIAERFSNHYKSVFIADDGRVVDMPVKCAVECNKLLFTRKSVCDSIRELSNGFACGPDGLPPYFYKQLSVQVALPLNAIFQRSFDSGEVPLDWRSAVVTPAFKGKGKRDEPGAYRPISLTCFASRIMERIIKSCISQHLDNNRLLSPNQHGFMKNKSTETQLLECFNYFTEHLDNKDCIDVVYLDISKAFDTVCHAKLFTKLSKYGITGELFSWIRAFLTDRTQSVIINGKMSSAVEVSSGVPQGSVLGPLLFLIFINDVEDSLRVCKFKLFADDCKLFVECKRDVDFHMLVQDVENIFNWFDKNQLKVAAEKCNILHLGKANPNRKLTVNNTEIAATDNIRDLGLIVRSDLKPSSHCEALATKAFRVSNLIFRTFRCRNRNFLVSMLKVYVLSLFNHCSVLYNPYLIQDIRLLESVQRRFTKRIPGLRHTPYFSRLKQLGLQTLERTRLESDLCHCFKIINGLENLSFQDFFDFSVSRTRTNGLKLFKPRCRTDVRKHFFANRVVDPWNSLSEVVVNSPSLELFKKRLKSCDLSRFLKYEP